MFLKFPSISNWDLDTWKTLPIWHTVVAAAAKGVPVWGTCIKKHNNGKSQQLKSSQSILMVNGNVFSYYYLTQKQSVWHVWHSQKDLHRCTFQVSCMAWTVLLHQKSKKILQNADAVNASPARSRDGAILDGRRSGSLTTAGIWDPKWKSVRQYVWWQSQ